MNNLELTVALNNLVRLDLIAKYRFAEKSIKDGMDYYDILEHLGYVIDYYSTYEQWNEFARETNRIAGENE